MDGTTGEGATKTGSPPPKAFRRALALAALGGLVIRLIYTLGFRWNQDLKYDGPIYVSRAQFLLDGHGFTNPDAWFFRDIRAEGAIHPPLNTLFLAVGDLLGFDPPQGARLWGCLLGTATVVLVGLLGREAFNPRVGIWAAVLAAIHPGLWSNDPTLMAESPAQFLTALLLLLVFRFWRTPTPSRAAWLGGVAALGALTRSELLVLAPALVIPVCIAARGTTRQAAIRTAAASLWLLAVLAPWVGWNMVRFEQPATIATGIDTSLRYANCEASWYGPEFGGANTFCGHDIEYDPANTYLDESTVGAMYRARAGTYARDHLARWPVVITARLGRTMGVYRPATEINSRAVMESQVSWASLLASTGLIGLATVAIIRPAPYARRRLLVLLTPLAAGLAGAAITFGTTRYKAPGEIGLVVLAALGITVIADAWKRRARRHPAQP